jgi:AcrR family transcriptional regulator
VGLAGFRGSGVNAGLTVEVIVDGALAQIESDGFETLTMRKLATALEVTPMSIYRHVANKHDLLILVADRYLVELASPATEDWRRYLLELFTSLHEVIARHPVVAAVLLERPLDNPVGWKLGDRVFAVLLDAGIPAGPAGELFTTLLTFTIGFAVVRRNRTGAAEPHPLEERRADYPSLAHGLPQHRSWLASSTFERSLRGFIDSWEATS